MLHYCADQQKAALFANDSCIGLGDVYKIGIGRFLQWNIAMDDDIRGRGWRVVVGGVPEAWIHIQKDTGNT